MHPHIPVAGLFRIDSGTPRSLWHYVPLVGVWGVVAALLTGLGPATLSALQIALDEHFELTKGWLWAEGIRLYDPLWNDQPPLLTVFLGGLFRLFGPDIAVARAAAWGFGLLLWAGITVAVSRWAGPFAAALATFALFTAWEIFFLFVSVLLEVPAFTVALWALWPIQRWQQAVVALPPLEQRPQGPDLGVTALPANRWCLPRLNKRLPLWLWPLLSGALLAVALQIKLTAAIVAPALVVEWLCGPHVPRSLAQVRQRLGALGLWTASLLGGYAGLAMLAGHVPLRVLWDSHFSAAVRAAAASEVPLAFPGWCLQREFADVLLTAGLGLLVLVGQRRWQALRFPLIWLLTAAAVHSLHRPWWSFYFLHFAVPLAWLTGCGVAALFERASRNLGATQRSRRFWGGLWLSGAALMLSALITFGGERLWRQASEIYHLPRVEESGLVAAMRRFAGRTHWVYTQETIFPFHAGLRVVPELALQPAKRSWSSQISQEQIWDTVIRYLPEQLLLSEGQIPPEVRPFIVRHYDVVYQEGAYMLFVLKSVSSAEP